MLPTLLALALALPAADGPLVVVDRQVLRPTPALARDGFGEALALDGDRLAVGAPQRGFQPGQSGPGHVTILERDPAGTWSEVTRLTASDGQAGDRFGEALALAGDTLLVGAPGHDGCTGCQDRGAVYVFELQAGTWTEVAKLSRAQGEDLDELGAALALDGDRALAGAPADEGLVLLLERTAGAWSVAAEWPGDPASFLQLHGRAVALDGGRALTGAPGTDLAGYDSGAALVWEEQAGGWFELELLEPSGAATLTEAGLSLALAGDLAVVGARSPFTSGPGAAWVFRREGPSWVEVAGLVGDDSVDGDEFGAALDLAAGLLAVGAPGRLGDTGAVYLFSASALQPTARLEGEAGSSRFGAALHLAPGRVAVGAPGDDLLAQDGGAVHLFEVRPALVRYCVSTANSTGAEAVLGASGSTSVAANDLLLRAAPVPDAQPGLFFYGTQEVLVPFGNGFRCVGGPPLYRLPVEVAAAEVLSHALDLAAPPQPGGQILAGSTWRFQAWFRDPAAGGSAFDLSDGARILFVP